MLRLCQQILNLGGYSVLAAGDGKHALALLQKSAATIHLALLDVMMPGMNGIELAKHIHNTYPAMPIMLMTGCGRNEIARVVDANRYRIIWKPFKTESLLRMIENALGDTSSAA